MMSRTDPPPVSGPMPSLMKLTMKIFALLPCLLASLTLPVVAEARTYLAELVVFARHAGFGEEQAPADSVPPSLGSAVSLGPAGGGRFARLTAGQLELGRIAATLSRNGYRVLTHVGWVQPGLARNQAVPVRLDGPGLQGSVRVDLAHYLHLNVDLLYTRGDGATARMQQSKAMRSGEINYLDGPVLGVIALFRRAN